MTNSWFVDAKYLRTALVLAAGQLAGADLVAAAAPAAAAPQPRRPIRGCNRLRPAKPFDYAWLKGQARFLAGNPYQASKDVLPPAMASLELRPVSVAAISHRSRRCGAMRACRSACNSSTLGAASPRRCISTKSNDGQAREIVYDPSMFEFDKAGIDPTVMRDHAGFAGFRVQFVTDWKDDVAAFLGAAYFRAVGGDTRQYGLSARALAVDTAYPRPEEFPRFTAFWFERPAKGSGTLTMYALMDSPSIAGALRFHIAPGGTHGHGHRLGAVSAQAHRAIGRRAAHQHVLLRRERSARGERLAAGNSRLRRPVDLDRRRRVDLAAAHQSGAKSLEFVTSMKTRAVSACCSETAIGITTRTTACTTIAGRACGSSPSPGGWGKGAVQLFEIPTVDETFGQHRGVLESGRKDQGRAGAAVQLSPVLGHAHALRIAAGANPRHAHRHRRHRRAEAPILFLAFRGRTSRAANSARSPRTPHVEAVITTSHGSTTEHVTAHYVEEIQRLPRVVRCEAGGGQQRAHRLAHVPAHRRQAADGNVDLSVDAAVREGSQGGARACELEAARA